MCIRDSHCGEQRQAIEPRAREDQMVIHAEVRVTQVACRLRERDQIAERPVLTGERDERKVGTELHPVTGSLSGVHNDNEWRRREIEPAEESDRRPIYRR